MRGASAGSLARHPVTGRVIPGFSGVPPGQDPPRGFPAPLLPAEDELRIDRPVRRAGDAAGDDAAGAAAIAAAGERIDPRARTILLALDLAVNLVVGPAQRQ